MKTNFTLTTFAAIFLCLPLHADDNAAPAPSPAPAPAVQHGQMLSFLSQADQEKYNTARTKALADNPDLKAELDALMKERADEGASFDRKAFRAKMAAFQLKLRPAMLKEDPTLQPIFDQIDKHEAEMQAKRQAAATSASGQ